MVGVPASRGSESSRVVCVPASRGSKSTRVVYVSARAVAESPSGVAVALQSKIALPADGGGTGGHGNLGFGICCELRRGSCWGCLREHVGAHLLLLELGEGFFLKRIAKDIQSVSKLGAIFLKSVCYNLSRKITLSSYKANIVSNILIVF